MGNLFEADPGLAAETFAALAIDDSPEEAVDMGPIEGERSGSPPLGDVDGLDKTDGISITPRPHTETGRARTQEITSSFKVIPQIKYTLRDWHGLESELEEWFRSLGNAPSFLKRLCGHKPVIEADIENEIRHAKRSGDFSKLLYFALGCYAEVDNFDQHRANLVAHSTALNQYHILKTLDPDTEDYVQLTLIFVLVVVGLDSQGTLLHELAYIQRLVHYIASFRWSETYDIGPHTVLLRACLMSVLGSEAEARTCQTYLYKSCGVELDPETSAEEIMATPLDYEGFRQMIMARYPSYNPPDPDPQTKLSVYDLPPQKPTLPNLVTVDVPASIEEACELFHRKTLKTPEVVQFWDEQSRFLHGGAPPAPLPEDTPQSLRRVEEIYNDTILVMKSFATVLLNFVLQQSAKTDNSGAADFHSSCLILRILLRWFRLSHVLKFEFLSAILFDLQFHLITYKYCLSHAILETVLSDAKSPSGFWAETKSLSRGKHLNDDEYGLPNPENGLGRVNSVSSNFGNSNVNGRTDGIRIDSFSPRALEIFISLVGITRTIISDKTQRIIIVAELPADALKQLMLVYNRQLWMEALQIFKIQAPFNGKKWRSMNMELISAIYLHCPPKLNDTWLSGQDMSGEIKVAASQEETLRNMIEFYNSSRPGLEHRQKSFFN